MNDYTISKPIEIFGTERAFRALSGQVIKASQRSDTYVSGGGSGAASSVAISSSVVVTSDMWIRGQSGQEYHLRFGDIPFREGNVLHVVDIVTPRVEETKFYFDEGQQKNVAAKSVKENIPFSEAPVLIYNSDTGRWNYHKIKSKAAMTNLSLMPVFFKTWILVFVISMIFGAYGVWSIYTSYECKYLDCTGRMGEALIGPALGVFAGLIIAAVWTLHRSLSADFSENNSKTFAEIGEYFNKSKFYNELDEVAKHFSASGTAIQPAVENNKQESTVRFCTQCGGTLEGNVRFCGKCGTQLAGDS